MFAWSVDLVTCLGRSDELAVAGDHAPAAYDQGAWWMVHHCGGDGVGSDNDEVGGCADAETETGVVEHIGGWPRASVDNGSSPSRSDVDTRFDQRIEPDAGTSKANILIYDWSRKWNV